MARKPDPPGGEAFVVRHFNTYLDCAGSMSTMTMTDPPPSESPSDKQCVSFSVAKKYGARNCNNSDEDSTADFCSNDQLPRDSDTLSSDDELLKSMAFPQHSFMAKYIYEYATMKGFLPVDEHKEYFTSEEFSESFTIKSHDHSLESNTNQNKKHSRRGYYCCSSKSHGRIKGTECCFCLSYFGVPGTVFSCLAPKDQTFPTIIDYPPN
jgi:hypothetical protein